TVDDGLGAAAGSGVDGGDRVFRGGVDGVSGATLASEVEAAGIQIDGDDGVGTGEAHELDGELADDASAEHRDRFVNLQGGAAHAVQGDVAEDGVAGLLVGDDVGARQAIRVGAPGLLVAQVGQNVAGVVAEHQHAVAGVEAIHV